MVRFYQIFCKETRGGSVLLDCKKEIPLDLLQVVAASDLEVQPINRIASFLLVIWAIHVP